MPSLPLNCFKPSAGIAGKYQDTQLGQSVDVYYISRLASNSRQFSCLSLSNSGLQHPALCDYLHTLELINCHVFPLTYFSFNSKPVDNCLNRPSKALRRLWESQSQAVGVNAGGAGVAFHPTVNSRPVLHETSSKENNKQINK